MLESIREGLYGFYNSEIVYNGKIAGFDLDWTLIRPTKSKFSNDENDWAILPNRLNTLRYCVDNGYTIVIFTNQKSTGKKLEMTIRRICNVIKYLNNNGVKLVLLMATKDNTDRKPNIGMFNVLRNLLQGIRMNESFYVGDAAGRPTDFSDSDKVFAENLGIKFYIPEDFFPRTLVTLPDPSISSQYIIIFVGMPGSGKTSFYKKELEPRGWVHINQDTLKTYAKVMSEMKRFLKEGRSVVIDNTNPSIEKRRELIKIGIDLGIPSIILYFVDNGHERNKLREKPVPQIAYNMYYKNLTEPTQELDGVPVIEII